MNETKLVLIILIIVEICNIFLFFYLIIKTWIARKWIKHEGLIMISSIECTVNRSTDNKFTEDYRPNIHYKYTIDDKIYVSKHVFFGDFLWQSLPFTSFAIKKKYKIHDKVIIYYNPKKPQQSVLERGIHFIVFLVFLSAIILLIIILFIGNHTLL
jgi:hypothetical protein